MPAADAEARLRRAVLPGDLHRRQPRRAAAPRRMAGARRQRLDPRRHAGADRTAGHASPSTGSAPSPAQMQGFEVLVKRPAGLGANADGVRVVLEKVASVTTAVDCDVHLLGLRKASEAEVLARPRRPGALSAAVATLSGTVTGISDALASCSRQLATTAPGGVLSHLALNYLTAASTTCGDRRRLDQPQRLDRQPDLGAAQRLLHPGAGRCRHRHRGRRRLDDARRPDRRRRGGDQRRGRLPGRGRQRARRAHRHDGGAARPGLGGQQRQLHRRALHRLDGAAVPASFSVVAKGGTVSAQQNCPSPFMAKIAVDATTTRTIVGERSEAQAKATRSRRPSSTPPAAPRRRVRLRIVVRLLDAAGASLGSRQRRGHRRQRHRLGALHQRALARSGRHRLRAGRDAPRSPAAPATPTSPASTPARASRRRWRGSPPPRRWRAAPARAISRSGP